MLEAAAAVPAASFELTLLLLLLPVLLPVLLLLLTTLALVLVPVSLVLALLETALMELLLPSGLGMTGGGVGMLTLLLSALCLSSSWSVLRLLPQRARRCTGLAVCCAGRQCGVVMGRSRGRCMWQTCVMWQVARGRVRTRVAQLMFVLQA